MNQKRCSLVLISFLLLTFLVGVVSAAGNNTYYAPPIATSSDTAQKIQNVIGTVLSIAQPITEQIVGISSSNDYFFARVLFFMIILSVAYLALNKSVPFFNENGFFLWLVSVAVAVLATRYFITDDWIKTILLPYQALGVAISAGLPFVLYFVIINIGWKNQPSILRKSAWIFFGVIFIGLWFTTDVAANADWIYPVTAVLALFMAILDGNMNRFLTKVDLEKAKNDSRVHNVRHLKAELAKIDEDWSKYGTKVYASRADYLNAKQDVQNRIDGLHSTSGFFHH